MVHEILRMQADKTSDLERIRQGAKACVVLFPLLGITWVFGVLSVTDAGLTFQYIFTILNSLQVPYHSSQILGSFHSYYFFSDIPDTAIRVHDSVVVCRLYFTYEFADLTFESVDKILVFDRSNKTCLTQLSFGITCLFPL